MTNRANQNWPESETVTITIPNVPNYGISSWANNPETGKLESVRVKLDAILEGFSRLGKPTPYYLTKFMHEGVRYSYEDFDTLSSALRELKSYGVSVYELRHTIDEN